MLWFLKKKMDPTKEKTKFVLGHYWIVISSSCVCVCVYSIHMCFFFTKLSSLDSRVSGLGSRAMERPIFLSCPFQLFIEPCYSKSVSICREYAAYLVGIFFYSMHFSRLFNIITFVIVKKTMQWKFEYYKLPKKKLLLLVSEMIRNIHISWRLYEQVV
jgi:hypothetical protein